MALVSNEQKQERFNVEQNEIISDKMYNGVLMGVTMWGLLLNTIMCFTCGDLLFELPFIPFIIGYIVLCIAGTAIANASNNPIVSFIGFNMVAVPLGVIVAGTVQVYAGIDAGIVFQALAYTVTVVFLMLLLSTMFPQWFLSLGKVLLICLLLNIVVGLVLSLFIGTTSVISTGIGALIFSLYIGYDFQKAQQYPHTIDNAVDCALDLYVDIINLFLRILRLLGRRK